MLKPQTMFNIMTVSPGFFIDTCWIPLVKLNPPKLYRHRWLIMSMTLICFFSSKIWGSQGPLEPPGDTRPKLPYFEPPAHKKGSILPTVPMITTPDTEGLSSGIKIYIQQIRVTGSSILSNEELKRIITPYENREISFEDLPKIRNKLTLAYVNRGYISSGAVIPKQSLADGILEVYINEGQLTDIRVETDGRFRGEIIRNRIRHGASGPVNVFKLDEQLQFLQQDPRTRYVEAELAPGEKPGQSVLNLNLYENKPYRAHFEASNYQSPAIGSWRGVAQVDYLNLTGVGDKIGTGFRFSEGLWEVSGRYDIPLNARNTVLSLYARTVESEIVEEPFERIDIESNSQTYGLTLEQPISRTIQSQASLFLTGEWRRSKSFLFGSGFSFVDGPEEGASKIAVVRTGFNLVYRSQRQVLAARSTISLGIDILEATDSSGDTPDGQFFSWFGQAQWARHLGVLNSQLIVRLDSQLSNSALLGLEQFAIGGHSTVRGYRENTLVRDNGVIASVEMRVPVLKRISGVSILEVSPFFDWGHSWNTNRDEQGLKTLASLGIGARFSPKDTLHFEIQWAEELKEIDNVGEHDLQDEGVHISISWDFL